MQLLNHLNLEQKTGKEERMMYVEVVIQMVKLNSKLES